MNYGGKVASLHNRFHLVETIQFDNMQITANNCHPWGRVKHHTLAAITSFIMIYYTYSQDIVPAKRGTTLGAR